MFVHSSAELQPLKEMGVAVGLDMGLGVAVGLGMDVDVGARLDLA